MLLADSLVVIGMATASLGTIHEADGVKEHSFWLRNAGQEAVALQQGYTSCGCTTIHFAQGARLQPGDSSRVTLRFNPRGKGGEFHEVGTIEYGKRKKRGLQHIDYPLKIRSGGKEQLFTVHLDVFIL